jgi:Zn-dependent protease
MDIHKALSRFNVSLGSWFGVPVTLHWSWVILFTIILLFSPVFALAYAGLFFVVLLHELGHCMAGKYYRVRINDIVLYPFGGAARMVIPDDPWKEIVIALAGPAVNVLLILPLFMSEKYHPVLRQLHITNIALLLFNLLPAFPMDGGRVLRASLSWLLGNHLRATRIAVVVGQGFCVVFAGLGFFVFHPTLILIAAIIYLAGKQELSVLEARSGEFQPQTGEGLARRMNHIAEELRRIRRERRE